MDIRELRTFIHVARSGSVSRAAAELFVAQPALSRQIAKLEAEIGVPLLVRHGRGVRLTAAGARLLERAELITHMVSATGAQVRASADEQGGHIAIGLPPAVGLLIGEQLVRAFRDRWPRVSLHVREGLSTYLQEWVLDRRVDLAVVYNQPLLDSVDVQPLFSEPMVLVGPARPEGGRDRVWRIAELGDVALILPALPHSNRLLLEKIALQHGVRLRVDMEVDSVALTKKLVAAGLGYTISTATAIQAETRAGTLIAHPIERPAIRSSVAITTLREQRANRLVSSMAQLLTETMHELITHSAWRTDVLWLGK
ncbi:LysR family transcriptional regulator [Janthinobacterium sp. PC23-8]|uniref:LysR family transcriptional regulator n=1 Tax=Janthinobacterium sp. PC23-8 TaxID=2012679 RepID=UPI000B97AF92|nr:LysR family transcriptional regulator [Janthinobacterium sp. PC23-8]OYO26464.1 transcriptional regulator [Janthinobacterium sp. PC23-8]